MAKKRLVGRVNPLSDGSFPSGPFTYKFEFISGCTTSVTFSYNDLTGTNSLSVSTANDTVTVFADFPDEDCTNDSSLGTFRLTVNNQICSLIVTSVGENPCYDFNAQIQSVGTSASSIQTFQAGVSGGNTPLVFKWRVTEGSGFITGGSSERTVLVDRSDGGSMTLELTATDANGCSKTVTSTLAALGSAPVVSNFTVTADCADDILIDIIGLSFDTDGTIDPSSITIVDDVSNGSTSINTQTGIITYSNSSGSEDTFTFTVQDNNGQTSNTGRVNIYCGGSTTPVANQDTVTTACETPVTINVLTNDTDSDGTISSVRLVTAPNYGTAIVDGFNRVVYTPNNDFEGVDYIRYEVVDNDGKISRQSGSLGLIEVTVGPCCDNHSAGLSIACAVVSNTLQFTATNSGDSPNNISSDTIEYDDDGTGYQTGSVASFDNSCVANTKTVSDVVLTDGVVDTWTTKYNSSTQLYKVTYSFASPISQANATAILGFIASAKGVFEIVTSVPSTGTTPDDEYLREHMTNIVVTTEKIEFDYDTASSTDPNCASEMDSDVNATHVLIETEPTGAGGFTITGFRWYDYSIYQNSIKFRRTIVRSNSCPNIVVEIQVDPVEGKAGCAGYSLTNLQVGAGTGAVTAPSGDYEAVYQNSTNSLINAVTVGGTNIVSGNTYNMLTQKAALETAIDNWLASNGGGSASVYVAGGKDLIVQIYGTTQSFQSIGFANSETANFSTIN